ncbi:MAG: hypothetical protein IIB94_10615 [Candidatus Marinimicrobia bacterium]|nr:hypothetical protein [Candidatus Neomarinimicrobiota bacterium]
MAETVFILGAGASKEAGAPLMNEFLESAIDVNKQLSDNQKKEHFKNVISNFTNLEKNSSTKSYLNIENIEIMYGALEMAELLGYFPSEAEVDISKLKTSLTVFITTTLEKTIKLSYSNGQLKPPPAYSKLVKLITKINHVSGKNKCSVLTFNYDLCLDYALKFNVISYDYFLDEGIKNNTVPLLKLHGSLNWIKCEECGTIHSLNVGNGVSQLHSDYKEGDYFNLNITKILQGARAQSCCEKYRFSGLPLIIPPTWSKSLYHGNLKNVWSRAAKELADAENIYIIGYSLPESDSFFRYLFSLGTIGDIRIKRLWVFNPDDSDELKKRYSMLIGQGIESKVEFKKTGFLEAMIELLNE